MLTEAIDSATKFLKKELQREGTLLGAVKVEGGWEVKFEVTEKDTYIAKIVPDATTYSRNTYSVALDPQHNVISFENLGQTYTHPREREEESA